MVTFNVSHPTSTGRPPSRRLANGGFYDGYYYTTLGGKRYDTEQQYVLGSTQERNSSPDMYKNVEQYGLLNSDFNSDSSSTGLGDSDDKMFSFLDRATDKQFNYQKQLMGETNRYRTMEGATQGQMDEQAHRRLSTQVASQQFMQRQGADLTERQRGYDSARAIRAFKGNF